jgi:cytoskeletal protein RodZ
VAKNAYPYPPDEFDRVDVSSRPKEVHAVRRGAWSQTWPYLLVLVLIPAVAFAVVYFLGDRLPNRDAQNPPAGGDTTETAEPPEDTKETPPQDEQSEEPPPQTPPVEESPAPVVDKAVTVTVYNITTVAKCAADTADTLTNAGYTAATSSEGKPATPTATTVYYSTEEQAATAQDIATTLSVGAPELNAEVAGGNLVVVVAQPFTFCDGQNP